MEAQKRPVAERLRDWREVERPVPTPALQRQASRCMDCGVPFCHQGCPLGNHVPEWNERVTSGDWRDALDRLHATNNFPEMTGRVCPAPCEDACVLQLQGAPVTIRHIEREVVDRGFAEGWVRPRPAGHRTGRRVAVVGSGPAGLACAQQLARVGHDVTVLERDDRLGGLLRYGIPDFKLEKHLIDRRLEQMRGEGVVFHTGVDVGRDVTADELRAAFDAVCLATGAQQARALRVPGSTLPGVSMAMPYLTQQNRRVAGDAVDDATAAGRRVVILGGGDTGADCLGTALRQGAASAHHFHYKPAPPSVRPDDTPWPFPPLLLRDSSSHEEGGVRDWSVVARGFGGRDRVESLQCVRVDWSDGRMVEVPGSAFEVPADLVLVAIGFEGPEPGPLFDQLGLPVSARVPTDARYATSVPGVFACGDARRGASLVVWAIREGREAAAAIHAHLRAPLHAPSHAAVP